MVVIIVVGSALAATTWLILGSLNDAMHTDGSQRAADQSRSKAGVTAPVVQQPDPTRTASQVALRPTRPADPNHPSNWPDVIPRGGSGYPTFFVRVRSLVALAAVAISVGVIAAVATASFVFAISRALSSAFG